MPDPIRVITLAKQGPSGPIGPQGVPGEPVYVSTAVDLLTSGQNTIGVTDTSSPRTVTISSIDIAVVGKPFLIKDESGGADTNNILIDTEGSETIDGLDAISIVVNYGVVSLYSNGINLFLV